MFLAIDSAYCNGRNRATIKRLVKFAQLDMRKPDVVVLLDIEDKERLKRIYRRDGGKGSYKFLFGRRFSRFFTKELRQNVGLMKRKGIRVIVVENHETLSDTIKKIQERIRLSD
jgi:thymidylate kinase